MELRDALEKIKNMLDVLEGTKRKAGCSDAVYRTVVSAQVDGILASGVPEAISFAIAEVDKQAEPVSAKGRSVKKQDKEMNEDA